MWGRGHLFLEKNDASPVRKVLDRRGAFLEHTTVAAGELDSVACCTGVECTVGTVRLLVDRSLERFVHA